MPEPSSSQMKAFFMMALWLVVKNPSLQFTNDGTGLLKPNDMSSADKPNFLKLLSSIAESGPNPSVATDLYNRVLGKLTESFSQAVVITLGNGEKVAGEIQYAQALLAVRELLGIIGSGALAAGQVPNYDPVEGCSLLKIENITQ